MTRSLDAAGGYDAGFLPDPVPVPIADPELTADVRDPLPYMHFTVAMSRSRRLARWVAWNIDGQTRFLDIGRDDQRFRVDPRLPADAQVTDEVYSDNRLDRGHLARRADLLWGTRADAERANFDSFYFTNITPQMDTFNQAERFGVWGRLEIALLAAVDQQRACVLAGPVLGPDDPEYRGVRIPREFWKLLAYQVDGIPRARIFLVTQSLVLGVAPDPLAEFEVFAITADELHARTGLMLDPTLAERVVLSPAPVHRRAARLPIGLAALIRW